MARKKKIIEERPVEDGHGNEVGRTVVVVTIPEARPLVTFGEGHDVWKGWPVPVRSWDGAIVRLKPPPDATDERVEQVRGAFPSAAKVILLPRSKAAVVPAEAIESRRKFKALGPRAVVLKIIEEANSADKEALRGICEKTMSEAGL